MRRKQIDVCAIFIGFSLLYFPCIICEIRDYFSNDFVCRGRMDRLCGIIRCLCAELTIRNIFVRRRCRLKAVLCLVIVRILCFVYFFPIRSRCYISILIKNKVFFRIVVDNVHTGMVIEFHYVIADISNVMGAYCIVAEIINFPICISIIQVPDICRGNPGLRRITSCSFIHRDLPVFCVINSGSIYPDGILLHGHIRWQNISH